MTVLCPVSRKPGKKVPSVTVRSLVRDARTSDVDGRDWFYCDLPDCEVVYFAGDGTIIPKCDLKVRVGAKESDAPHPVCYCFGHTVESIRDEIERTGKSTVLASITARVKAGECRCNTMNPKGTCCLGDVNQVVMQYALAAGVRTVQPPTRSDTAATHDCCAATAASPTPRTAASRSDRAGILATGASIFSALAATACCWLPLLLVTFGVSAAGVAAAFERIRPVFVVVAPLLLGAGFYFLYRRPAGETTNACCTSPTPRMRRFNRIMLWVCAPIVLATVFFPDSVFRVFRPGKPSTIVASEGDVVVLSLAIEGMTCEGCTAHVERELAAVPGVQRVSVDYEHGTATVAITSSTSDRFEQLVRAIERAGYRGHPAPLSPDTGSHR